MRRRECMPQRSACSECGPACMTGSTTTVETPRTPARSKGFVVLYDLLHLLIIQIEIEGSDEGLGCHHLGDVADAATEGQTGHVVEEGLVSVDVRIENSLDVRVLRRVLDRTHELGEGHDVLLVVLAAGLRRVVCAGLVVAHMIY